MREDESLAARLEAGGSMLHRVYGLRLLLDPRVQAVVAVSILGLVVFVRLGQLVFSADAWMIGYDFSAYWLAASNLLEGGSVYTADQAAAPYPAQQQFLYLYPPFLAVLVMPFAALSRTDFQPAAWAWAGLGLVALAASVIGLARVERVGHWRVWVILLALGLALPPVALEMLMGNVHLLLLGLLSAAWLGVRIGGGRGDLLAGVAIAAATLVKVFPILLLLWLLLTGRRRAAAACVVALGVLVAASLPFTGLEAWLSYPRVLANLSPPVDPSNVLAPTVWLSQAVGFDLARILVTGLGLLVLVWSARTQGQELSFAVAVVVSLIVVPALYLHYLALLVLPLLLAYARLGAHPGLLLGYGALFAGTQLSLWQPESPIARGLATLSLLVFAAILLLVGRRSPARPLPVTLGYDRAVSDPSGRTG